MKTILVALLLTTSITAQSTLMGFSTKSSANQRALEKRFDASLNKNNLRDWMKQLSARPHHVGSTHGKANAEFMASLFRSWGFEAKIERFDILFPTPKTRLLEMTAPEMFTAKLEEPVLKEDSTSGQKQEQLPPYNAYSVDGDVTAGLVFVNYGIPKDYEELAKRGISVKGKIVIAKYGGSWRGIKPKVAAENGAIGCIMYSDPRNDGYFRGDVYPKGPWRMEYGAQRGSVADMPLFPGDPLTPGVGSVPGAKRLSLKEAPTLTKIPVLPISYADALPLLKNMEGPVAPAGWRGALPITYHLGGEDKVKVRLKLEFNWETKPAYNVIARMKGSVYPDQWIMRGNHHDAWVNGAADPISGMVALLEEARAIGELAKTGWRPKRTILYGAWDAEEPGLIGSVEWVEHHADELKAKLAVYINTDGTGRGFLGVGGSHTLEKFINEVAKDVKDPQLDMSLWERIRAARMVNGNASERKDVKSRKDLRIGALGSGSDYTPFLQHLGIASLNMGFGGESGGGSYHSAYDSFDHYTRFGDPDFAYGITLVKVAGRTTLRLAEAETLQFEFTNFADTVAGYVDEVEKLTKTMRENTKAENSMIRSGMLKAAQDPRKTYVVPDPKDEVPHLNFAPLKNAMEKLKMAAMKYDNTQSSVDSVAGIPAGFKPSTTTTSWISSGAGISTPANSVTPKLQRHPSSRITGLNELLFKTERALTSENGLPGRNWFRHQIYAPGFYTGYGVKT
ncbi:MAG: M28 family peptidase, partial [Pyrinomonadaceae bacterium]|nr:M28 family peptidase [Pyrinomonadaceae bacterium]